MICADADLGEADQYLHKVYTRLLLASEQLRVAKIRGAQRNWLKQRGKCSNTICLQKAYQLRSNQLAAQLSDMNFYSVSYDGKEMVDEVLFSKFPALRELAYTAKPEPEVDFAWGLELLVWERNQRYLVVRLSSWSYYKGAAHPDSDERFVTLQRKNGEIVRDAILLGTLDNFSVGNQSVIRAAYLRHFGQSSGGCEDLSEETPLEIVATVPSRLGLGLIQRTSYVNAACAGPFFIRWNQVTPLLSEQGNIVMKEFTGK